jgi:hypothetical protein
VGGEADAALRDVLPGLSPAFDDLGELHVQREGTRVSVLRSPEPDLIVDEGVPGQGEQLSTPPSALEREPGDVVERRGEVGE